MKNFEGWVRVLTVDVIPPIIMNAMKIYEAVIEALSFVDVRRSEDNRIDVKVCYNAEISIQPSFATAECHLQNLYPDGSSFTIYNGTVVVTKDGANDLAKVA